MSTKEEKRGTEKRVLTLFDTIFTERLNPDYMHRQNIHILIPLRLCGAARPSHSVNNLHRPVHCCGVVVDKK